MNKWLRKIVGQRGGTLTFSLLGLSLGVLLVSPMLLHVGTGQRVAKKTQETLKNQYTSDAGIEYALWKITHEEAFREVLCADHGTGYTVITPGEVNGAPITVRIACVPMEEVLPASGGGDGGEGGEEEGPILNWVIWGNSSTSQDAVKFTGGSHKVYGGVHSNCVLRMTGNGHKVYGPGEYHTELFPASATEYFTEPWPVQVGDPDYLSIAEWDIAVFQEEAGAEYLKAFSAGQYYFHPGNWKISGSGEEILEGLHYCAGDVSISGSGVHGRVTIVAEGEIKVSGAELSFTPYVPALTFMSCYEGIEISGAGNVGGTCYAPNGLVKLSGSNQTIEGAFLGDQVHVSGCGAIIGLPVGGVEIPGMPDPGGDGLGENGPEYGLFDVESTSGNATTTVRVRRNLDGSLIILSWSVS